MKVHYKKSFSSSPTLLLYHTRDLLCSRENTRHVSKSPPQTHKHLERCSQPDRVFLEAFPLFPRSAVENSSFLLFSRSMKKEEKSLSHIIINFCARSGGAMSLTSCHTITQLDVMIDLGLECPDPDRINKTRAE